MPDVITEHALILGCIYGAVASFIFHFLPAVRKNAYAQIAYVFGFLLTLVNLGNASDVVGGGAKGEVMARMLIMVAKGVVLLAFNFVPIQCALDTFVTGTMRAISGDDIIKRRRTYDKAEGAEARGELDLAERLYREYLAEDATDPLGHRKLAELLLNKGDREAAVKELELALKVSHEPEEEQRALWRLGEVHEEAGRADAAREYYEKLLRRYPDSRTARYASRRLEKLPHQSNTETP